MQQIHELAYERLVFQESLKRALSSPRLREKLKADLEAIEAELRALEKASQEPQEPLAT